MSIHQQQYHPFPSTGLSCQATAVLCLGLIILIIMAFTPIALAGTVTSAPVQTTPVKHDVLPNGLEIYVYEDHATPGVSVNLWYKVGSRDEPPELQGMAHLLEHMMFNGSKRVPKNGHAHLIDAAGGMLNAFTTNDVTVYWNKVPSSLLPAVLELEAERMANLEITPGKVSIEKEIVKEEYRIGFQNDAIGAALDQLLATSLEGTPYAWTPAGAISTIDAITAYDLQQFYRNYYTPNNAVLVIAGDTDIETAYHLAHEAFGSIEPRLVPPRNTVVLPQRKAPTYVDITMPLQLPTILGGYVIPGTTHQDSIALQMASLILSAGQSSRLHQRLVREQGLAVAAAGYAQPFRDAGLFLNLAFHLDKHDPDMVIEAMREEIEGMAQDPPSRYELEKARNQVAATYCFQLDSLDGIANAIGSAVVLGRGIEEFEAGIGEYLSVTPEDVQTAVGKHLRPENLTVFRVIPGNPSNELTFTGSTKETDPQDEGAIAKQDIDETPSSSVALQNLAVELGLAAPEAKSMILPTMTHFQLDNGLEIWLIERPEQPIATLQLVLPRAGTYVEPVGKAGLANFTAAMLRQGTKNRTAEEISQAIDATGGSLNAWADDDGTTVLTQVMSKDLALAVDLLSDITIAPTFPIQEVETLRQQILGSLYRLRDNASAFANDQAMAYHYGSHHPLGRPASIASIQSIQSTDMETFVKEHYNPQGAILVAAGDIEPVKFEQLVESSFGQWRGHASIKTDETRTLSLPEPPGHSRLLFIEKPGQTQVQIRMVQRGPARGTPDWISLDLYNYILGGGSFSSRLMQVIRSEMGETYGIGSGYRSREHDGMFMLSTFTGNEKLYRTMKVIKSELEKFALEGVTEEELQYAKANRIGSYPLRFETLGGTASTIISGLRFRSLEEIESYPILVENQSKGDVEAAIAKHFDPNNFAIVLLGDPAIFDTVVEIAKLYDIKPDQVQRVNWLEID
ncbi:MAG: insulinase family protein [Firmicutes bacterium]|nr:insulinase family protein [Bacillota bacterium]